MTVDEAWSDALVVAIAGHPLNSRDGLCYERIGWKATITGSPVLTNDSRKFSKAYAAAELLWYLSESCDGTMLRAYAPQYERFLDVAGNTTGAYGFRWRRNPGWYQERRGMSQLGGVTRLLREHPETRQAVITMWDSADLSHALAGGHKDLPCTVCLQFLVRGTSLHVVAYLRSNDVWLGMPYDVFCFMSLQRMIADELSLLVGEYTHCVGSLHIYERDLRKAVPGSRYLMMDFAQQARMMDDYLPEMLRLEEMLRTSAPELFTEQELDDFGAGTLQRWMMSAIAERWGHAHS